MISYSENDGKLLFAVQVVARASQSRIVGEHNGALRVRIAAPPVDGAANDELVRTLARAFDIPRSAVQIVAGHGSRLKQVSLTGASAQFLTSLAVPTPGKPKS